ncbi:MAG: LysR substrate-binding domain-containing protein [Pseudomonadota bacterium]
MQKPDQISLNAIRVFVAAAEHGSFKLAADHLAVTPGAVSRQIKNLEASLGAQLFKRSNNAIHLTDTGAAFLRQARSGLDVINHAIQGVLGDGREITVQVPTTLATRWLIPLLSEFKKRWPDIAVRIETHDGIGLKQNTHADIVLAYFPITEAKPDAEVLIEDRCRPYLSPSLLSRVDDRSDLSCIPALQCTRSNWDWKAWLQETETPELELQFGGHFDLDDVALRAAISGLGMVLAPEFIIRDDLAANRLCALPDAPAVLVGCYTLHTSAHMNSAAKCFAQWLRETVSVQA